MAVKLADNIKKEREWAIFRDLDVCDKLEKQRKTAFRYFQLERSTTLRRELAENNFDATTTTTKNVIKNVSSSSNFREDAAGKLVRYRLIVFVINLVGYSWFLIVFEGI